MHAVAHWLSAGHPPRVNCGMTGVLVEYSIYIEQSRVHGCLFENNVNIQQEQTRASHQFPGAKRMVFERTYIPTSHAHTRQGSLSITKEPIQNSQCGCKPRPRQTPILGVKYRYAVPIYLPVPAQSRTRTVREQSGQMETLKQIDSTRAIQNKPRYRLKIYTKQTKKIDQKKKCKCA